MAQSGRSWNDPKSARARAAGSSTPPASPSGQSAPAGSASGRATWRDKSAPAVAPPGKQRHWLVSRSGDPNRLHYRVKLAIAGGVLLLLFGAFLVYTLWAPRNTPLLLVGVFDYAAPLPPNAWTFEDFERFRATFLDGAGSAQNVRVYSDLGERNWRTSADALSALETKLKDGSMQPGGPGRKTVLIYLSGHGVLDADGKPCLVLATDRGGANSWQPQLSRLEDFPTLDLQKTLDTIDDCYAGQSGVKKVVLLDCSRIHVNPQLGILENRFDAALASLRLKDDMFVLSSAGPAQLAWTLPDRRASAFGFYVCKGLAGRADEKQFGGNEDGVVTLDELERYVRKQVNEQVQARYLVEQSPLLLPDNSQDRAAETPLAWSHPDTIKDESQSPAPAVPWSEINALWARHSEIKQSGVASLTDRTQEWRRRYSLDADRPVFYRGPDLLSWEAFQHGLLRLEQLNDSGRQYADAARRLKTNLSQLVSEIESSARETTLPPAIALRQVMVTPEVKAQVDDFISGPPKEAEKEAEALKALLEGVPQEVRAKAVWNRWQEWAQSLSSAAPDYRRTLAILAAPPGGSPNGVEPVEIRFMRLLNPANRFVPREVHTGQALPLRSALESRDLAEAAAWANDDNRVHYVVEQLVARGDAARRRAEDQLFIQPSALGATGRPWNAKDKEPDAEAPYQQALALAVELSSAIDARDQAWQDAPYLAEWLVLRHDTDAERNDVDSKLAICQALFAQNTRLASAIDRVMDKCLTAGENTDEVAAARFASELAEARKELNEAQKPVRENLDDLTRFHADAISDANQAAGATAAKERRRMSDLLTTPLLTGETRSELRETLLNSRRSMQSLAARNSKSADGEAAAKPIALKDHPLLGLFGTDPVALAAGAGRLASKLRTELQSPYSALRESSAAVKLANDSGTVSRAARKDLANDEKQARKFAALWTLDPTFGAAEEQLHDPLSALDAFDRHHVALWQARRALDDFWGHEGGGKDEPADAWYFKSLATTALDNARLTSPGERSSDYQKMDSLLIEREKVARQWVEFPAISVQLPPASDRRRAVDAAPAIGVAAKIPVGEAALLAERPNDGPAEMRFADNDDWQKRLPVSLSPAASAAAAIAPLATPIEHIAFHLPDGVVGAQKWNVDVFYRGHVHTTELAITPKVPGQLFELKRIPPEPPRIMVKGERTDPGAVSFILDCSGSMGQGVPGTGRSRMDHAKSALRSALDELAKADQYPYRVSLWCYGHRFRANWDQKNNRPLVSGGPKVLKVWDLAQNDPARQKLVPPSWAQPGTKFMSEDAALEWPTGGSSILKKARLPELIGLLNAVQPSGVTPLYFSIVKAVTTDPNLQAGAAPRRLIVLTDGADQPNSTEVDNKQVTRVTPKDVADALKGRGIQFHVLGFGEVAGAGQNEIQDQILKEIKQPANYHAISPGMSELEKVIREVINLKSYDVRYAGRPDVLAEERVNSQVELREHRGRKQYQVEIVGSSRPHQLTLEGGESIDLVVDASDSRRPRLVHERYSEELRRSSFATKLASTDGDAAAAKTKFFVGIHTPKRESGLIKFPISIQNSEPTEFSPRPAEAWAEITPLGASADAKPLVFYDLQFAEGRPVPVLEYRTPWPAGATRAKIELFFKMQATETPLRREVREVEGKPDSGLSVAGADGRKVRFSVTVSPAPEYNGARITVNEHCDSEADLHRAKVEIEDSESPADVVRRQYYRSANQQDVVHEFIYFRKVTQELLNYRVRITSRKDLESEAYRLNDVVEIEVP